MPTISKINGLSISAADAQYVAAGNVDGPLGPNSIESANTASYISPTFISASAAASGFGSGGAGGPESDPIFSAWSASAASKFAGTSSLALTASYSTTLGASISNSTAGQIKLTNSAGAVISTITNLTASLALTASSLLGSVATASYAATASLALTVSQSQAGSGSGGNWLHRIALLDPGTGGVQADSPIYYDHNGITYNALTNLLTVGGTISANSITASLQGTASWAANATTASFALTSAGTAANATSASFASTASYLNNLNQNLTIVGNLNVVGTASYTLISASQLDVGTNTISVNVAEPAERFGGLVVYDSGSLSHQATASLFWDSLHNHWVYQNASGSTYSGGMFMSGPRNTGSLGDEPTLTKWFITRGDGGDHLNDTQIFSSGSVHIVTGSLTVTGDVIATASWASNAVTASYVLNAVSSSYAANGGVTQLIAGSNIILSPTNGLGAVTISSTGGGSSGAGANVTASFTNQSTWTFTHALSNRGVVVQTYDTSWNQIIPETITLTDSNTATITFPSNESGYAIASLGGVVSTAATASYVLNAISSSFASTASFVNTLNQNVLITGSVTVSSTTPGPAENSLTLGARDTGAEGGQLGFNPGPSYASASFLDVWQNSFRLLKGTSAGSNASLATVDLTTGHLTLNPGSIIMPARPAFRVVGAGTGASADKSVNTILSGSLVTVDYNQGSYYDNTNGQFTCPLAGLYHVWYVGRSQNASGPNSVAVLKNNGTVLAFWENNNANIGHFGTSAVVSLAANDVVTAKVTAGTITFDSNDNWGVAYIG